MKTFLDNLDLDSVSHNSSHVRTVFAFNTFAIQVEDLNVDIFNGQTFIAALGPIEQALNISDRISQNALITVDGAAKNFNMATGSLHLSLKFFDELVNKSEVESEAIQRLSHSIFLSDAFFNFENRTLGSIIVAARTRYQLVNKAMVSVPVRTSFQVIDTVRITCKSLNFSFSFHTYRMKQSRAPVQCTVLKVYQ